MFLISANSFVLFSYIYFIQISTNNYGKTRNILFCFRFRNKFTFSLFLFWSSPSHLFRISPHLSPKKYLKLNFVFQLSLKILREMVVVILSGEKLFGNLEGNILLSNLFIVFVFVGLISHKYFPSQRFSIRNISGRTEKSMERAIWT